MKISLAKDTFFYSLSSWGQKLLSVILAPVTIAYFSPGDFGYLSLVNTVATFLFILGMLAVADQSLPRFFIDASNEQQRKEYIATTMLITLIGNATVLAILFLSIPAIPVLFKDVSGPLLFAVLVAALCVTQSYSYLGNNLLRWTFQSALFTKINLIKTALSVSVSIIGIVYFGWRVKQTLVLAAVLNLFAGTWANFAVREYMHLSLFSLEKIKEMLLFAWPLLGLNLFAFFTLSLNRVLLARLSGLHDLGIYSVSTTVAALFETATAGFFAATGPYYLATYKEEWAPRRYAEYFSALSAVGVISVVVLSLWGAPLIALFRHDGTYREIGIYIPWILAGTVLYYLGAYFAPGPYIEKKTYWSFVVFAVSTAVNAVLCFLLIPTLGVLGCGIAVTCASMASAVLNQVISNRMYPIPNKWLLAFSMVLGMTVLTSALQNGRFSFNINQYSLLARAVLTIVLLLAGVLPFYYDIRHSHMAERAALWLKDRFSPSPMEP
jgi:O-antigen/teichoic acid export membrane protein